VTVVTEFNGVPDNTSVYLDELDLTECVMGPDLLARFDETVTVYRRDGQLVRLVGVFDGPAPALAALDALDCPDSA
jgi:hypothetical protein